MRSKQAITPTSQLILRAVADAFNPLTRVGLIAATGASTYTIERLTQQLVKRELLHRERISALNYFSMPVPLALKSAPAVSTEVPNGDC